MIINFPLLLISFGVLLFSIFAEKETIISWCIGLIIILALITVLTIVINLFFSNYGINKIIFHTGYLVYKNIKYPITNGSRLIYSKISIWSIFNYGDAGELVLIANNKKIKLGRYFQYEIN